MTNVENTFAKWMEEVLSMVRELEARRRFDTEVSEWLKETDRVKDFEAWRKAKADANARGEAGDGTP